MRTDVLLLEVGNYNMIRNMEERLVNFVPGNRESVDLLQYPMHATHALEDRETTITLQLLWKS